MVWFSLKSDFLNAKVTVLALYGMDGQEMYSESLLPMFDFQEDKEYVLTEIQIYKAKEALYKEALSDDSSVSHRKLIKYYDQVQNLLRENERWYLTVYIHH